MRQRRSRFVCERLSFAVVAIGTMSWSSSSSSSKATRRKLGFFPILFQHNDNVVQVEARSSTAVPLQTGDRLNLGALDAAAAFRAAARSARENDDPGASHAQRAHLRYGHYGEPARLFRRAPRSRAYVGTPLCFFLSLALASALFLMRPRPITLAFYLYTMLMLIKVNETPLDLAAWPISFVSYVAIQFVYPAAQLMILIFAQRLYGGPETRLALVLGHRDRPLRARVRSPGSIRSSGSSISALGSPGRCCSSRASLDCAAAHRRPDRTCVHRVGRDRLSLAAASTGLSPASRSRRLLDLTWALAQRAEHARRQHLGAAARSYCSGPTRCCRGSAWPARSSSSTASSRNACSIFASPSAAPPSTAR